MRNLRVGLVGYGSMGRNHARVLSTLPGVELVGICDPGTKDVEHCPAPIFETLDEMLEKHLDYAVIASPTLTHEAVARQVAEAQVHALIEKPLALNTPSAERIVKAFSEHGLIAGVGHIERFNGAVIEMRRRIRVGQLGKILQVATRRQGPFPERVTDVGVVMDLLTHDIDVVSWICGGNYDYVFAVAGHGSGGKHEDLVTVSGRLQGGEVVSHIVNWLSPYKERLVTVTGERGALVADLLLSDLTYFANERALREWEERAAFRGVQMGDVTRYAIPRPEPLRAQHEAFRDSIGSGCPYEVSLNQASEVIGVATAVLQSVVERGVIQLKC